MPPASPATNNPAIPETAKPAKQGYLVTLVAFAGALLATIAVTTLALVIVALLVKTQSEGEAQFWLGLVGGLLVTALFLISWPVLTY